MGRGRGYAGQWESMCERDWERIRKRDRVIILGEKGRRCVIKKGRGWRDGDMIGEIDGEKDTRESQEEGM